MHQLAAASFDSLFPARDANFNSPTFILHSSNRTLQQLLNRIPCAAMDSVKMESVQIKEEFPELELVPIRVEFSGLASLPIKQELCERQCDCCLMEVSEIKAEHNELEIPLTEESLPVKQEEVLETVLIKREPPEVEFDHMEPGKEESEDFKPNIPELEPVRLRECSVVLERICVREQGAGEEGSPNSTQGGGKEDGRSHSECSLAARRCVLRQPLPSQRRQLQLANFHPSFFKPDPTAAKQNPVCCHGQCEDGVCPD
ncbi:UNVERIFIED_CONTAM: hypothetical protein FKN15_022163 [Acipenser sinensis]